jgi:hypothetical protein
VKYLYDENQSFDKTHVFSNESDAEVRQHIDLVYEGKAGQRTARQEQISTTVNFVVIGLLLIVAGIGFFIFVTPTQTWLGFLCSLPGLLSVAFGIQEIFKSMPDFLEETIRHHYNVLKRLTSPSTGRITDIEALGPGTRRISFRYTYQRKGKYTTTVASQGSFITTSSVDLVIGDEVAVVATEEIAVLL